MIKFKEYCQLDEGARSDLRRMLTKRLAKFSDDGIVAPTKGPNAKKNITKNVHRMSDDYVKNSVETIKSFNKLKESVVPKASVAAVKRIPGWMYGWATFKKRLMVSLGIPADQFYKWDVPKDWQEAYKKAAGR